MSDIISLIGYDIRGQELRAEAEQARLIREIRDARRAEQPRDRRWLSALRDRLFGDRGRPVTEDMAEQTTLQAAPAALDDAPAEPEPAAELRIPVGSRS